jgi:RNA polymerase sigma-70 factor (ECF subfamily)
MADSDVSALIEDCIRGSDAAKAQFYADHVAIIRRAVARTLRGSGVGGFEVEDLTNEVFARLYENECHMFRRLYQPRSVNAWLVAIARHLAIDDLRRRNARDRAVNSLREEAGEYAVTVSQQAMASEERERVLESLAELETLDRLVLDLYFLQGLKYAEISDILSLNINTVAARIRRAKAKLREALGDLKG